MVEKSWTTISPLLLRNLVTSVFMFADKPLSFLADKNKLLYILRCFLVSVFLFLQRFLPILFSCFLPYSKTNNKNNFYPLKKTKYGNSPTTRIGGAAVGDTGVARALTQLLSLVNEIPVSSRKYESVRALAEKLIEENLLEDDEKLREINCVVMLEAFERTVSRLEAAMLSHVVDDDVSMGENGRGNYNNKVIRLFGLVKYYGEAMWRLGKPMRGKGVSAEKLAAEVLWLAQKMVACGCGGEAVNKWACCDHLAWLALNAEPRLQGSLVKITAYLFMKGKDPGSKRGKDSTEQPKGTKMRMLMLWLPLLCRGSNGTDAPVLSILERNELEKILRDTIESLEQDEQEQVLSLWLHHFTQCASSDWPNLQECYTRWFDASRRLLLNQL
ncbi:hypothetical protein LIER_23998 [Lithospermum erythrorhizon]|uniref:Uncharacterized protein n=1 Tax=Lithospermum erythrorhizon TaxID=34254 RepID=A0AAV3R579_LITER